MAGEGDRTRPLSHGAKQVGEFRRTTVSGGCHDREGPVSSEEVTGQRQTFGLWSSGDRS